MNIQAPKRMSVDEFLAWAEQQPGRYELINGVVRQMSPETVGHIKDKHNAVTALTAAIKRAGIVAFALADGATVRISSQTSFEPDALVYMPPEVDRDQIEISNPIIVVENASRSTRKYDSGFKLENYMKLPSVQHVILVNGSEKSLTHCRRTGENKHEGITHTDGILRLDPPGIEIPVADFFDVD